MFNILENAMTSFAAAMEHLYEAALNAMKALLLAFMAVAFVPFEAMHMVIHRPRILSAEDKDMTEVENIAHLDQVYGGCILPTRTSVYAPVAMPTTAVATEDDAASVCSPSPICSLLDKFPMPPSTPADIQILPAGKPDLTIDVDSSCLPPSISTSSWGDLADKATGALRLLDLDLDVPEVDDLADDDMIVNWRQQVEDGHWEEVPCGLEFNEEDDLNLLCESASFAALRRPSQNPHHDADDDDLFCFDAPAWSATISRPVTTPQTPVLAIIPATPKKTTIRAPIPIRVEQSLLCPSPVRIVSPTLTSSSSDDESNGPITPPQSPAPISIDAKSASAAPRSPPFRNTYQFRKAQPAFDLDSIWADFQEAVGESLEE